MSQSFKKDIEKMTRGSSNDNIARRPAKSVGGLKLLVPLRLRARAADLRGRGPYSEYADRYKAIFIHVPKTAGKSVAAALFGDDSKTVHHVPYFSYAYANPRKFRTYFKFAFVRNPWDRVVSAYAYLCRPDNRSWAGDFVALYPDFGTFVDRWIKDDAVAVTRFGYKPYALLPQSYFLLDRSGRLMVDFLGRFENLHSDFRRVAMRLGFAEAALPSLNTSDHCDFRSYYTDETREIVGTVYASDIAAFGYRFRGEG